MNPELYANRELSSAETDPETDRIRELSQVLSLLRGVHIDADVAEAELAEKEQSALDLEKNPHGFLEIFADVSEAPPEALEEAKRLSEEIGPLPKDPYEAALHIRSHIMQDFHYDLSAYTLQDLMEKRAGNCLGMALLYGSILKEKGIEPKFELLLHPEEKRPHEKEFFEMVRENRGEGQWDYENPPLPDAQAEEPQFLFAALEHPVLMLNGKRFETTRLDPEDIDDDPHWAPTKVESSQDVRFSQLASTVIVERQKQKIREEQFNTDQANYNSLKQEFEKAILLWPDNRELWHDLAVIATAFEDRDLAELAQSRYVHIGGNDSRFFATMYEFFHDTTYLDLALEKYPEQPILYTEKRVVGSRDTREARYDFAVAAFAVANSSIWNLPLFYQEYESTMRQLFGEQKVNQLFKKMRIKRQAKKPIHIETAQS